jgi:hypothetical protein
MSFIDRNIPFLKMYKYILIIMLLLWVSGNMEAQSTSPELETTTMKIGHIWLGVTANGDKGNFNFTGGFFPNDFGILGQRGQYAEAYTGAGIQLTATHWFNPAPSVDSIQNVAIYSFAITAIPEWNIGKVTAPLTNYLRYKYPVISVNDSSIDLAAFGTYNPSYSGFQNHTYDETVQVTDSTIFGINVQRKLYAWTQTYNNNYIIADLTFTNVGKDTLDSLYINMQESEANDVFSQGQNPAPGTGEGFDPSITWQHYYGGRSSELAKEWYGMEDSMRVFYEYSADDPERPGDNMGAQVTSQQGRLLNPNMQFYAILHASKQPYTDPTDDINDPLEPKVTYIGKATQIPLNQQSDTYGSKNFYGIRGGYSTDFPEPGSIPGTYHGINNDELGIADYSNYVAGYYGGTSYKYASFGPYTFKPGQKIHIVYASGFAGIGYELGQKVGKEWLNGTLQNPPNMPDPNTGWLPSNFKFPDGATEMDKRKDRWVSMGIDSVMLAASRAQWNYDHNYSIPQAPPPPDNVNVIGYGTGIVIKWSDPDAEQMSNFNGYRVMRRISNADTIFYQQIYNSNASDKATQHEFKDTTAIPSSQTYYYIQAKALIDQQAPNYVNADPTSQGKIMYSSRCLYPDVLYLYPPRLSQNDLSKIRIAPNPYNIKDPLLVAYGYTDQRGINFFNLPPVCTIKIFTENGDLVQTIHHDKPLTLAGSETWNMITSSQQVINSGIYIAVFQKPDGAISYQKFIVVR